MLYPCYSWPLGDKNTKRDNHSYKILKSIKTKYQHFC